VSTAVIFLVIPIVIAIVGSVIIWAVSRRRRPAAPDFAQTMQALAPNDRSRSATRPPGIVPFDDSSAQEQ